MDTAATGPMAAAPAKPAGRRERAAVRGWARAPAGRLAVRLLVLVLILAAADAAVGTVLEHWFRGSPADVARGLGARAPVAVVGSSRARHHYDPRVMAERMGAQAWNFGMDGQFGPAYTLGISHMLLSSYRPRLLVVDVQAPLFYSVPEDFSHLSSLTPYAREYPQIRPILAQRSRWERLKLLSRTYPYNSRLLELLQRRLSGAGPATADRGYEPVVGPISPALLAQGEPPKVGNQTVPDTSATSVNAVDAQKMRYLREMVAKLRANGVRVVAVRSPTLVISPWARARDARQEAELRRVLTSVGVPFIDYSSRAHPAFNDPGLYHDWTHLNERGAEMFSREIADVLRPYLR